MEVIMTSTSPQHEHTHGDGARAARQYRYSKEKDALVRRMRKIEGQARGIQKMIEDDRYCPDIVQQLTALCHAAEEVSLLILRDHIEGCVTDAIREQRGEEMIRELMDVIRRTLRA
jgi:CsoR family transcriptional regulator, copper-sensing transcriptional repressor